MKIINFIGNSSILIIIGTVVICGFLEKKDVFELFTRGVISGGKLMIKLFPTLLGLFVSVRNAK